MKKLINLALTLSLGFALCSCCPASVFAYDNTYATNYGFESGPNTSSTFGKPTGYDEPVKGDPLAVNLRRNKDAAFSPPAYGFFSGDFPTNPSSLYHDNSPSGGYTLIYGLEPSGAYNISESGVYMGYGSTSVSNGGGNSGSPYGGNGVSSMPGANGSAYGSGGSASGGNGITYGGSGSSSLTTSYSNAGQGLLQATSASAYNTVPKYYDDGSMGVLTIERLNKSFKVYEGETLENMKKGIGHFESTSAWDGNVGFAGHNRGAAAYFGFVKDLNIGDKIRYTTPYGERVYEVFRKEKISEYDYSGLGWAVDNIVSLITCVENQSELRWLVQAAEVR